MRHVLRAACVAACEVCFALVLIGSGAQAATPGSISVGGLTPTASFSGLLGLGGFMGEPLLCPPASLDSANALCDHVTLNVAGSLGGGSVVVSIGNFTADADFDLYVCVNDATSDAVVVDSCLLGREVAASTGGGASDSACFDVPAAGGTYEARVVPFFVHPGSTYGGTASFASSSCSARGGGFGFRALTVETDADPVFHVLTIGSGTVGDTSGTSSSLTFSGTSQGSVLGIACPLSTQDPTDLTCSHFTLGVQTDGGGSVVAAVDGFSDPAADFDLFVCSNYPAGTTDTDGDLCDQGAQIAGSEQVGPDSVCFDVPAPGGTFEVRVRPYDAIAGVTFAGSAVFSFLPCAPDVIGKVTGGGAVETAQQNFAFSVRSAGGISGKLRYENGSSCRLSSSDLSFAGFRDDENKALIRGVGTIAGYGTAEFEVTAADGGEPATSDVLQIDVPDVPACNGGGMLVNGNLQFHAG